jgi:hypothetical protein
VDTVLPSLNTALPIRHTVTGLGKCSVSRRHAAQLAALACRSLSINSVGPARDNKVAVCIAMLVLPTPPFVLIILTVIYAVFLYCIFVSLHACKHLASYIL